MPRKKTDRFTGEKLLSGSGPYDITDHHVIGKKIGGEKYGKIGVIREGHQYLHKLLDTTMVEAFKRDGEVNTKIKSIGTVDVMFTGGKVKIGEDGLVTIEKDDEVLGLCGSFTGFRTGDLIVTGTHPTGVTFRGQPGQEFYYAAAIRKGKE